MCTLACAHTRRRAHTHKRTTPVTQCLHFPHTHKHNIYIYTLHACTWTRIHSRTDVIMRRWRALACRPATALHRPPARTEAVLLACGCSAARACSPDSGGCELDRRPRYHGPLRVSAASPGAVRAGGSGSAPVRPFAVHFLQVALLLAPVRRVYGRAPSACRQAHCRAHPSGCGGSPRAARGVVVQNARLTAALQEVKLLCLFTSDQTVLCPRFGRSLQGRGLMLQ